MLRFCHIKSKSENKSSSSCKTSSSDNFHTTTGMTKTIKIMSEEEDTIIPDSYEGHDGRNDDSLSSLFLSFSTSMIYLSSSHTMNWTPETTVIPSSYSSSSIPSTSSSSFSSSSSFEDENIENHFKILSYINPTGVLFKHSHVQDDDEEEDIIDEKNQDCYDIIEVVNDDDEDNDDDADDDNNNDDSASVTSYISTTSTYISKSNGDDDDKTDDDAEVLDFNTARSVIAMEVAMEATIRRQTSTFNLFRLDLDLYTIQTIGYGPPATSFEQRPIYQQGYSKYDYQDHNHDGDESYKKEDIFFPENSSIQIPTSIAEQAAAAGLARLTSKQIKRMTMISNDDEYVEKNETIVEIDLARKIDDVNRENSTNIGKVYYDKEQLTVEVKNLSTATIDDNDDDDSNNASLKSDADEDDGGVGENEDGDDGIKTRQIEDNVVEAAIVEDRLDRKNVVEEEIEVEDNDDDKKSLGTSTNIVLAEKEKFITKEEEKELTISHLLSALSDPSVDSTAIIDGKEKVAIINNDNVNTYRILGEVQDKDSHQGTQNVSSNNVQMMSNKEVEDGKVVGVEAVADSTRSSSATTRLIDFASLPLFRKQTLRQWRYQFFSSTNK